MVTGTQEVGVDLAPWLVMSSAPLGSRKIEMDEEADMTGFHKAEVHAWSRLPARDTTSNLVFDKLQVDLELIMCGSQCDNLASVRGHDMQAQGAQCVL